MRTIISTLVQGIEAYDALEREHIAATLAWIASGAPLFRLRKPDLPPQHLVSYFVLVDQAAQKLLLVDHKVAGLWLPSGGHVEPDEHPRITVRRELSEELGIEASFLFTDPLFLTVTRTVGLTAEHTDVSFWYVLCGDSKQEFIYDAAEFHGIRWFAFDAIPYERADPHMRRFTAKLRARFEGNRNLLPEM